MHGNETPDQVAQILALALECYADAQEVDVREIRVTGGFQPYVTLELGNGAEWQFTPVRSDWPHDGTSAQFQDLEPTPEPCGHCGGEGWVYDPEDAQRVRCNWCEGGVRWPACEPACQVCGDGGIVHDDGPHEGCAEFSTVAFCNCPAGREARDEERLRAAEEVTFALANR